MKITKAAAALALGCFLPLASTVAHADARLFDWTLTGPAPGLGGVPFPGSGTLTATETAPGSGVWDIDTIAGMVNGSEITGLSTFEGADNVIYTNGFAFLSTTTGMSFVTAAGQSINIFSFFPQGTPPTGNAYGERAASPGGFGVGTFTLVAVPESSTWAMLLVGFAGLGYVGLRRGRTAVA